MFRWIQKLVYLVLGVCRTDSECEFYRMPLTRTLKLIWCHKILKIYGKTTVWSQMFAKWPKSLYSIFDYQVILKICSFIKMKKDKNLVDDELISYALWEKKIFDDAEIQISVILFKDSTIILCFCFRENQTNLFNICSNCHTKKMEIFR